MKRRLRTVRELNMIDVLPYPVGLAVVVTKLCACKSPVAEPSSWESWVVGGDNPRSLPVDYEMRGFLLDTVEVGGQIHLHRTHRNGVEAEGYFYSSLICSIRGDLLVETFNSIYRVSPDFGADLRWRRLVF